MITFLTHDVSPVPYPVLRLLFDAGGPGKVGSGDNTLARRPYVQR